jgi:hypothetical protein
MLCDRFSCMCGTAERRVQNGVREGTAETDLASGVYKMSVDLESQLWRKNFEFASYRKSNVDVVSIRSVAPQTRILWYVDCW